MLVCAKRWLRRDQLERLLRSTARYRIPQEALAWSSAWPHRVRHPPVSARCPGAGARRRLPAHGAWKERHGGAAAGSPQCASRLPIGHILYRGRVLHARTCLNAASEFASVLHPRLTPQQW